MSSSPSSREQRLRSQPADAEWAGGQQAAVATGQQRRQQQGVQPQTEADAQAGQRAGMAAAAPEQAADDRRRELGHGGERQQADRGQRAGAAVEPVIQVGGGDDGDDGDDRGAADVLQQAAEIAAFGEPEAFR
ncbi:MAG: hypothetical protein Q8M37_05595, partial [Nevskia sp.]|nr:hypothetical protein [Nevskia sp.]